MSSSGSDTVYDAVLLGSGHNSLVTQARLARAGLSTLCLEGAGTAGGGLSTVEWPAGSGFLHNPHAFYHRGLTDMPWYRDLDLAARGAEYLTPELNVVLLTGDGDALEWHTDFEKTAASFARFSQRDAVALRRQQAGVPKEGDVPPPASYAVTPIAYTLEELDTGYYAVNLLSYVTLTTANGKVSDGLYAGAQLMRWTEVDGVGDWRLVQGSDEDINHLVSTGQPQAVAPGTPEYKQAGWIPINGAPQ